MLLNKKVYLRGAYGPGNLGDDVLLVCMISILSEVFPKQNIYVGVENLGRGRSLDTYVNFVHFKKPMKADFVIYGGGGQFFDFKEGNQVSEEGLWSKVVNFLRRNKNPIWAIKRIVYSRIENCVEKLILSNNVATYAIGVGPFENKGKGYQRLLSLLVMSDYVSVRDTKSVNLIEETSVGFRNLIRAADPTFLPFNGLAKNPVYRSLTDRLRLFPSIKKVLFCFFYKDYDSLVIEKVSDGDFLVYDPLETSPFEFVRTISSQCNVLISSRAHGIWLPVILGKPVIGIRIENKIDQVCCSLRRSTLTWAVNDDKTLEAVVKKYIADYDDLTLGIAEDLAANTELNRTNRKGFLEWIYEKCNN